MYVHVTYLLSGYKIWEQLEQDLINIPNHSYIIIIKGDLNARVGTLLNYVQENDFFREIIPEDTLLDQANMDLKINTHGRCLIDLRLKTQLLILNGRLHHDQGLGRYTFLSKLGCM